MRADSAHSTPDADITLPTDGIVVHDLTEAVDNIELDVVPGHGLTYDGYDTLEECLDHLHPSIRTISSRAKTALAHFARRILGFH